MEFVVFKPKITQDFILSKINQETIMQRYTGLNVNSKKLTLSPFRSDHKVTCAFYKSKSGVLYLHDFATNEHINCFGVVMRLFNCNYHQALDIIAQDFKLIEENNSNIAHQIKIIPELKENKSSKIQVQIKDFSKEELDWWDKFGITQKLLKKYHVYSIQNVFLNEELKFISSSDCPIYGYYFGKDKNHEEKWKIYFPLRKEFRFINNVNKKTLQGYKQLPKNGDLLVITKSMKDCIALNRFGIAACAPNSETLFINDRQLEEFKQRFKHILILYDNDRPGMHNMWLIRKEHPELNYFYMPWYLSKDFTDSIKLVGVENMKEYIDEFMSNYKFK